MSRTIRVVLVIGLTASAAGIAVLMAAGVPFRYAVPPGIVILLGAAIVTATPWRWAPGVGVVAALTMLVRLIGGGPGAESVAEADTLIAIGRWLHGIGLLVAIAAGSIGLYGVHTERREREDRNGRQYPNGALLALGLVLLSPVCAEYLAAYDDSTGDPIRLVGGLLIFGPLYGAPALLIREAARTSHLGWRGVVLLSSAFGLLQAGVIDQSLFSVDYRGIASWDASMRATLIAPLGMSAHSAVAFVGGHVLYSFCAPIALMEGVAGDRARDPWLMRRSGCWLVAALYIAAATLVTSDHLATETSHASTTQLLASLVIVALLVLAAFRRPSADGAPATNTNSPSRPVLALFATSVGLGIALAMVPEDWWGFVAEVAILTVAAVWLTRAARRRGWSARHVVAVASGAVLSRALLAFTYFPLVGTTPPLRKYLHNVVLLAIVGIVSAVAAHRASHTRGQRDA